MKRFGKILLPVLAAALLISCASGETQEIPETSLDSEVVIQPEETEAPTETAPTEEPTDPPYEEIVRERLREGDYAGALEQIEAAPRSEELERLSLRAHMGDVQVGGRILLGHYEQDGIEENGPEEIEWVVLAVEEDRAFLLSLNSLDSLPYHDVLDGKATWEECTLRQWLNGEFLEAAFSPQEQSLLLETELVNEDNVRYWTPGGENTLDRVFLLSITEVQNYLTEDLYLAHVTPYAESNGCRRNYQKNGWWWLRSPGVYSRDAAYVDSLGQLSYYGYIVHRPGWSVRPALWVDLRV